MLLTRSSISKDEYYLKIIISVGLRKNNKNKVDININSKDTKASNTRNMKQKLE